MDVFLEYLMKKKSSPLEGLQKFALVIGAVFACIFVVILFQMLGSFIASYSLFGVAGVVYLTVVLLRNFNLEYEYIFTNGDLDIDVIKGRTTRKRLTSLHCRSIEIMASERNGKFKNDFASQAISKRFNAVYDASKGGIYHVLYTYDGERLLLTFQPPVKLLAAMQKMNPRNVYLEPEDIETETEIHS